MFSFVIVLLCFGIQFKNYGKKQLQECDRDLSRWRIILAAAQFPLPLVARQVQHYGVLLTRA